MRISFASLSFLSFCMCAHRAPAPAAAVSDPPALHLPAAAKAPGAVFHVLNRAAFGPTPADVAAINEVGVERWLQQQLAPGTDLELQERLKPYVVLTMSSGEAAQAFPKGKRAVALSDTPAAKIESMGSAQEIRNEAGDAKIVRAIYAKRQLEEVLVDFWFNHFNVSIQKGKAVWMAAPYEREAIRPFVFGSFSNMLLATAQHPAMLWYLDNWQSAGEGLVGARGKKQVRASAEMMEQTQKPRRGLNENYARELLELHTLGVNSGYTQQDVREAARALTGWSLDNTEKDGDYLRFQFREQWHDVGEKHIFGLTLPAGQGKVDGEQLLTYLAAHPSTARHLALKLCQKLVGDAPSPALVEQVATVFQSTNGNLTQVYIAIFESPEFWTSVGTKTKTPFEFVTSATRAAFEVDAITKPYTKALQRLGEPLYQCAAPTGYSEVAAAWVNPGALVSRINFALALSRGDIAGVHLRPGFGQPDWETWAKRNLGLILSQGTRDVISKAAAPRRLDDGEVSSLDVGKATALLLGSPEFQKQ